MFLEHRLPLFLIKYRRSRFLTIFYSRKYVTHKNFWAERWKKKEAEKDQTGKR